MRKLMSYVGVWLFSLGSALPVYAQETENNRKLTQVPREILGGLVTLTTAIPRTLAAELRKSSRDDVMPWFDAVSNIYGLQTAESLNKRIIYLEKDSTTGEYKDIPGHIWITPHGER